MTEEQLNFADVSALFEQVNRKRMAKRMRLNGFRNLRNPASLPALGPNRLLTDVLGQVARKEPVFGFLHSPPVPQNVQELRRK